MMGVAGAGAGLSIGRGRGSTRLKVAAVAAILTIFALVFIAPLYWLLIVAGKPQGSLFGTSTFLPGPRVTYVSNLVKTFDFQGGQFVSWIVNSFVYSVVSAGLAVYAATMAGYLLAWFKFKGRGVAVLIVIGSLAVPTTALTIPTFVLESHLGLTDSYVGVILALSVYPLGVFFTYVYAREAIPASLLDAGRVDGAGELRLFHSVALKLLAPGMATLFLLAVVASWNNYFLPLVLISRPGLFSATLGLGTWVSELHDPNVGVPPYPQIFVGSILSVLPAMVMFPFLQRFVASGASAGALAGE